MSDTVIDVKGISKRYRIGLRERKSETFAGQLLKIARAPLENFRQLTRMTKFGEDDESVFWALSDISFCVKQGEVLGIIGRNGAGKSTLLKILSRITEPTAGEAVIKGRVASLLEVGTGFHPELTGRENIYMNGTILGMTKVEIDGKLDEIIDFSGIEKFIDTPVKFYSSGMNVRLGFSVAAHLEPEILIIDEVLAVGDVDFQKKCLGKMKDVSGSGRTVLFVSHNMEAISLLCPRVITLNTGKINFDGNANDGISQYLNQSGGILPITYFKSPESENIEQSGLRDYAEIHSLEIRNGNELSNLFRFGESITFILTVYIKQTLNLPEFGIAISTARGQRIHHLVSSWDKSFDKIQPGSYTIRLETDGIRLYPNEYTVSLWVRSRIIDRSDHFIEGGARIKVTKSEDQLSKHLDSFNTNGGVFLGADWSVKPIEQVT